MSLVIIVASHEHHGVWDDWKFHCLFNSLFRLTSKETSKPMLLALCEGNPPPVTGGIIHLLQVDSPHKGPVTHKSCHIMRSSIHAPANTVATGALVSMQLQAWQIILYILTSLTVKCFTFIFHNTSSYYEHLKQPQEKKCNWGEPNSCNSWPQCKVQTTIILTSF